MSKRTHKFSVCASEGQETWHAMVHEAAKVRHDLATEQQEEIKDSLEASRQQHPPSELPEKICFPHVSPSSFLQA